MPTSTPVAVVQYPDTQLPGPQSPSSLHPVPLRANSSKTAVSGHSLSVEAGKVVVLVELVVVVVVIIVVVLVDEVLVELEVVGATVVVVVAPGASVVVVVTVVVVVAVVVVVVVVLRHSARDAHPLMEQSMVLAHTPLVRPHTSTVHASASSQMDTPG